MQFISGKNKSNISSRYEHYDIQQGVILLFIIF